MFFQFVKSSGKWEARHWSMRLHRRYDAYSANQFQRNAQDHRNSLLVRQHRMKHQTQNSYFADHVVVKTFREYLRCRQTTTSSQTTLQSMKSNIRWREQLKEQTNITRYFCQRPSQPSIECSERPSQVNRFGKQIPYDSVVVETL